MKVKLIFLLILFSFRLSSQEQLEEKGDIDIYPRNGTTNFMTGSLRPGPGVTDVILVKIPPNSEITILGKAEEPYFKVKFHEYTGYLSRTYIAIEENTDNSNQQQEGRSSKVNSSTTRQTTTKQYYRGPRGGCYYINSKGNKVYVDRSLCN